MGTREAKPQVSKRRRYTADEKAKVVEDAERMGVCAAAKKHGMDPSNVSRWRSQARASEAGATAAGRSEAKEAGLTELEGAVKQRLGL